MLISIGQIIDKSWDVYAKNFRSLMRISLWGMLVGAFILLRLLLLPNGESAAIAELIAGSPDQLVAIGLAISLAISLFAIPITSIWVYMNLVRGTDRHLSNKTFRFSELSKKSWRDFFPYLWVMILKSLASITPVLFLIPGLFVLVVSLYVDTIIANGIGFLLLFLGAVAALLLTIWLSVRLTFAGYAMLLDGKGATTALRESFRVTDGRFWATLWRILIPKLVFGSGVLIAEIALSLLLPLVVGSLYGLGETFGLYAGMIITISLTTGLRVLYPPVFIIADQLLYGSLKQTSNA